jgi:ketosteroid isomerase-like protein
MITVLLVLAAQATAASNAPPELVSLLRSKDQALLDAIAPGDRAIWDRTLTPDAIYVDENGRTLTRTEFLAELQPLPAGVSGQIRIADFQVHQIGDTATVVHRDEESESFHGQPLKATYLMTDTWVRRKGEWQLAMVHAHVMNADPPAITVSVSKLDEYVGRYTAGPDLTWIIRREGDHLVGGREGSTPKPLMVEMPDVLFIPGQPRVRKLFARDTQGRVTGFVDRREAEDIRWTRAP